MRLIDYVLIFLWFCMLGVWNFDTARDFHEKETEQLDRIELKQDSILKVNQAFRTYHLDHCAFKEIEK